MKDSPQLGKLIEGPAFRDAIHIAVAPMIAGEDLFPGEQIAAILNGKAYGKKDEFGKPPLGIVDPFLREWNEEEGFKQVQKGQKFWMLLMPNTITSLRHEWEHPAFATWTPDNESQQWLAELGASVGMTYDQVIEAAKAYVATEKYHVLNTSHLSNMNGEEFWMHFEAATGTKTDEGSDTPFVCSC